MPPRSVARPKKFVKPAAPPTSLPGDGVVLATRTVTVAASAAGLGIALTGRALRWPRMPVGVLAGVVALDYQPWLRRLLEDRIGRPATDTVLTLAVTAAETVTLSPASLSVGLLMQSLKAAECRAEARAWRPARAGAGQSRRSPAHRPVGGVEAAARPARRPPRRSIRAPPGAQRGAGRRHHPQPQQAATAILVTTPAANRTTPEAFAAALGQGLADRHAVLPLRPEALRRLDRVDAIVIDPRVLCTDACGWRASAAPTRSRAVRGVEPRPADAGKERLTPGLAPGARNIGHTAELGSGGAFLPRPRSVGSGRGRRGAPDGSRTGLGRGRLAG